MKKRHLVIILVIIAAILTIRVVSSRSAVTNETKEVSIGYKFLEENDYEQAILTFENILEIEPNNVKAMVGLAVSQLETGDYSNAYDYFKNALQKDPLNSSAWSGLKDIVAGVESGDIGADSINVNELTELIDSEFTSRLNEIKRLIFN